MESSSSETIDLNQFSDLNLKSEQNLSILEVDSDVHIPFNF